MFRGITAVADNGGRFLERLDALNLAAVVFSSDNGCSLGEPGLGARRTAHEESIRIPMRLRHTRGAKA
jgi:arylsulfatase A-like enzyme